VWFTAVGIHPGQDPYHRHLARVSLDGGGATPLTTADATHEWTFSPDGSLFLDRFSRVDLPWVTELRRSADGGLVAELGRDDAADLLAAGFRPPERFVSPGRDGRTDIHGIIIRPTAVTAGAGPRYPVIEDIYAGPQDHHVPKAWGFSARQRALAELGFVVVKIDGMGTNWRGKAFHDVCFRNLADAGLPDRIAWIRAAAATRPEMDLERVGIFGGSAGGQNALAALLHHGDFYDAAAADCGCHDNRLDKIWWNEAWMGWPVGAEYAANSNVTHAAKLRGKLLLTVGELDTNVDPSSTLQVARALIEAGRDFDFIVVPGGGHGVGETPYLVRRRQDFFLRALHGSDAAP
jgi:dipeptidyl aminopeptidase/acylaminoacyl peptidase